MSTAYNITDIFDGTPGDSVGSRPPTNPGVLNGLWSVPYPANFKLQDGPQAISTGSTIFSAELRAGSLDVDNGAAIASLVFKFQMDISAGTSVGNNWGGAQFWVNGGSSGAISCMIFDTGIASVDVGNGSDGYSVGLGPIYDIELSYIAGDSLVRVDGVVLASASIGGTYSQGGWTGAAFVAQLNLRGGNVVWRNVTADGAYDDVPAPPGPSGVWWENLNLTRQTEP